MNRTINLLLGALFVLSPLAFADSESERALAALTAERDKAVAEAIEPIKRRHQAALEQLLRHATQANDIDAAVKIKAALNSVDPAALGSRFRGWWANARAGSRIQFTPGGNFQENWHGGVQEGRWQATSETDATVIMKRGVTHQYHISDDGNSVKRNPDGVLWSREEIAH